MILQQKLYKASIDILTDFGLQIETNMQLSLQVPVMCPPQGHHRYWANSKNS